MLEFAYSGLNILGLQEYSEEFSGLLLAAMLEKILGSFIRILSENVVDL